MARREPIKRLEAMKKNPSSAISEDDFLKASDEDDEKATLLK